MTYNELYIIISKRHRYITKPTNDELQSVVNDLIRINKIRGYVTNFDLDESLNRHILLKEELLTESEDLYAEINIAQQILDKLKSR